MQPDDHKRCLINAIFSSSCIFLSNLFQPRGFTSCSGVSYTYIDHDGENLKELKVSNNWCELWLTLLFNCVEFKKKKKQNKTKRNISMENGIFDKWDEIGEANFDGGMQKLHMGIPKPNPLSNKNLQK